MTDNNQDLDAYQIEKALKGYQIPSQPKLLQELRREAVKEYPSIPVINGLVSKDVGLSAAVLKTINSPFFGLPRKIASVQQALVLMGVHNVINLVQTYLFRSAFQKAKGISLDRFWDSAADTANIASSLVGRFNTLIGADDAYSAGLFLDCGIALLATKHADYKEVLREVNSDASSDPTQIEDEHYSTNHAVLGYYAARSWGLSPEICNVILTHHQLDELFIAEQSQEDERRNQLMALLKMAENVSHSFRRASEHVEWERIKEQVYSYLIIDEPDYEDIRSDIHEMLERGA